MKRPRRKLATLTIEQMRAWDAAIRAEMEARANVDRSQLSRALAFTAGDLSLERSAACLRLYAGQMTGWLLAGRVKREPRTCVQDMQFATLADATGMPGGGA